MLLVTLPRGVATVILPDPVAVGTVVLIVVAVEELTPANAVLNRTLLLAAVVSKFVPVMVTEVFAVPTVGLKLVIVGAMDPVTVKGIELAAEPPVEVTLIRPEVALKGTVTVSEVAVAVLTDAGVPLNVTVF